MCAEGDAKAFVSDSEEWMESEQRKERPDYDLRLIDDVEPTAKAATTNPAKRTPCCN